MENVPIGKEISDMLDIGNCQANSHGGSKAIASHFSC